MSSVLINGGRDGSGSSLRRFVGMSLLMFGVCRSGVHVQLPVRVELRLLAVSGLDCRQVATSHSLPSSSGRVLYYNRPRSLL